MVGFFTNLGFSYMGISPKECLEFLETGHFQRVWLGYQNCWWPFVVLDSSVIRYQQLLNTTHVVHSDQVYQIINCLEFQSSDTKFIIVESIESNPNLVRHL